MQTALSLAAPTRPLRLARFVRNRVLVGAALLAVIAAAAAWQWSWLVALGIAPLLLSGAPCAAMCGLGLCMHRMGGRACAAAPQDGTPASGTLPSPSVTQET